MVVLGSTTSTKKEYEMKITLTKGQAYNVIQALEWAKNDDFGESDSINRMWQRIIDKIEKELEEE